MCTAFSMNTKDNYFGRNLDIDRSYGEAVCVMPRNFPLDFRKMKKLSTHYAMIGMATMMDGIPLFYDAANECGLSMAGLNFPGNAHYFSCDESKDNVTPFEFIPWVLGQCQTVSDTKLLLGKINLISIPFSSTVPLSPLHWIISDRKASIVVEQRKNGLFIYDNPLGVLTNNPPFEYHLHNLKNYGDLRTDNKNVIREDNCDYVSYSQGLGAVGLPGDVSSMSRFVRMAFSKENSVCDDNELSSVSCVFHLLSNVEMIKGNCKTDDGTWDYTLYSACINARRGIYYYTTYENRQITCVDMHKTDLNADTISRFPLLLAQDVLYQN